MNLSSSKPVLLWLLLLWQAVPLPVAPSARFRYRRAVTLGPVAGHAADAAQACAVLDAKVFAHAAPSLKDLRLYRGPTEIPYATTLSEPLQQESEDARILNLRGQSGHILFALEMPHRPYTSLSLDLAAHDYVATATVSGSGGPADDKATPLGGFTLFDLSSQNLSRRTEIPLPESRFPYLRLDLSLRPAPGASSTPVALNNPAIVRAATVPPSRDAQSIYTTTQSQTALLQLPQASVATFLLPPRVPVERIVFTLPPAYKGSFSRVVEIEALGVSDAATETAPAYRPEDVTGSILHVRKFEAGKELSADTLSVPVAIGSNMQQPARVKVMVRNGTEPPLPIAAVDLQMRQRRICFDTASATGPLTMYYGDPALDAPAYSDAKLSQAAADPRIANIGPEILNPDVASAPPPRRSRHQPVLRWVALLACIYIFALLVIRSAKKRMARH